jgi:hypothetical protein
MKKPTPSYQRHRFPSDIISHAVNPAKPRPNNNMEVAFAMQGFDFPH